MPIEAERDKAGGKLTMLALNLVIHFITARFFVQIVTNKPFMNSYALSLFVDYEVKKHRFGAKE